MFHELSSSDAGSASSPAKCARLICDRRLTASAGLRLSSRYRRHDVHLLRGPPGLLIRSGLFRGRWQSGLHAGRTPCRVVLPPSFMMFATAGIGEQGRDSGLCRSVRGAVPDGRGKSLISTGVLRRAAQAAARLAAFCGTFRVPLPGPRLHAGSSWPRPMLRTISLRCGLACSRARR